MRNEFNRQMYANARVAPKHGPTPMEIDAITGNPRGPQDGQQCRRCTGIGHWERDCPTRVNHLALYQERGQRQSITNVEISEEDNACLRMSHQPADKEELESDGEYCG